MIFASFVLIEVDRGWGEVVVVVVVVVVASHSKLNGLRSAWV